MNVLSLFAGIGGLELGLGMSARAARLRMFRLAPVDIPPPGTVASADLRTSICDARIALSLALGQPCDLDGYKLPGEPADLVLFEVAA